MDPIAVRVAKRWKDQLPGGLADEGPPKGVDPEQVAKGVKVEMEHTDDPSIAREIAYDHLTEDPVYYDKLEEMEKTAGQVPLQPEVVKRLQSELRVFAQEAEGVRTEEDRDRLWQTAKPWGSYVRELHTSLGRHLREMAEKVSPEKSERQFDVWAKKIRPLFDAGSEVQMLPEWQYWDRLRYDWVRRINSIADQFPGVITFFTTLKKKKIEPLVHEDVKELAELEGFKTIIREYDPSNPRHVEALDWIRDGLRLYRQRAARVLPVLLQKAVPFDLRFDRRGELGTALGYYSSKAIEVMPLNAGPKATETSRIFAHEMGHHLWQTVLSSQAQGFWRGALSRDSGNLDLREVLEEWKPGEPWYSFELRMRKENPVLYLQIQAVTNYSRTVPKELADDDWTRENIEAYVAKGKNPLVKAPATPITGYASTNPEEAFCEAVSLAVAYGPRTLDPLVRSWLSTVLPDIRMASQNRLSVIRKEKGKYCVRSPDNPDWNGGCYDTKAEAEKRLRQVEFFKHKDAAWRVVLSFAKSKGIAFHKLKSMSKKELEDLGCQAWDDPKDGKVTMLFPAEWYDEIPKGLEVVDIFGETEKFQKGKSDDDQRFGMLPYGVMIKVAVRRALIAMLIREGRLNTRIVVDVPKTLAARKRYSMFDEMVIARFDQPVTMYRVFDGNELKHMLASGKITGGSYSVKPEREHGASWGHDITPLVQYGNRERGKRFTQDIYLAKIDAFDHYFAHLSPEVEFDPNGPDEQEAIMDSDRCFLGLGCSIMNLGVDDVDEFYRVLETGQIERMSLSELKAEPYGRGSN